MLTKLKGKYIGADKIKSAKKISRKTYLGSEVYEVELDNKEKAEYPVGILDAIVTEEKGDLTKLRELKSNPVTKKVLSILLDSELTIDDINYILQTRVPFSVQESIGIAYKGFWGKNKEDITLRDVDLKLKSDK